MKTFRLVVALSVLNLLTLCQAQSLAGPTRPAERCQPNSERADSDEPIVPTQAHAHGKYRHLLRVLHVPEDVKTTNPFTDWGFWNGAEWAGYKNLPPGYWVYVYPRWYVWKEQK